MTYIWKNVRAVKKIEPKTFPCKKMKHWERPVMKVLCSKHAYICMNVFPKIKLVMKCSEHLSD